MREFLVRMVLVHRSHAKDCQDQSGQMQRRVERLGYLSSEPGEPHQQDRLWDNQDERYRHERGMEVEQIW